MSGITLSLIRAHTSRIPGLLSTRPYAALLRPNVSHRRAYAVKTEADIKIEEIQELYATAKDEFEIAIEETEKKSIYAEADRAAATEELENLKKAYKEAVEKSEASVGQEIKTRVGQRIRELEGAVEELNKAGLEE